MKEKLLPALGAGLWIAGLILAITGLNIRSDAGQWMSVTGNIAFLAGLGLEGVWWLRRRKDRQEQGREEAQKETQDNQDR